MRRFTVCGLLIAILATTAASTSQAQVMRELDPIQLEYQLFWGDPKALVGTAQISFTPTDTKRGRRLQVESALEYTLPRDTPFHYAETSTLICDEEGVTRFETSAQALGQERVNVAFRRGENYHVTTTYKEKKRSTTITSEIQRTNLGLFAGAFMAETMNQGDIMREYPMLFPVGGDHQPRQKVREAVMPFRLSADKRVRAIVSTIRHQNRTNDHLWHTVEGHQILLRMEAQTNQGEIIYELVSVNGVPAAETRYIQ